jgi:hypothetical protein
MVSALSPLADAARSISYSSPSIFLKKMCFFLVSVVLADHACCKGRVFFTACPLPKLESWPGLSGA